MVRGIIIFIIITAAISGTLTYFYYSGQTVTVRITEEHMLRRMNKKMPITKTYLKFMEITLKNPEIEIVKDTKRIRTSMDFSAVLKLRGPGRPIRGNVVTSGVLHYNSEKAYFYLTQPEIENMDVKGLSPGLTRRIRLATKNLISRVLENRPIHKLKDKDLRQITTRLILKHIEVKNNYMLATLGW